MNPISVHFHEIALKGGNRALFEKKLRDNVRRAIAPLGRLSVDRIPGGLLVDGEGPEDEVLSRVVEVCGVAHALPVRSFAPEDFEGAAGAISEAVRRSGAKSFRISSRRRDKTVPGTSVEVNRRLGAQVKEATGVAVRLSDAELDAHVLLLRDRMLVGTDKRKGVGGLPVGASGKVTALLSGGIDSPVAAWRLMKRGCRVELVHFHSYPRVDRASIEKAEELAERLARWQYELKLHLVPLAEIQAQIRLSAPSRLRVILYRRFMFRLAERLARKHKGKALVTGESVGQVASQTLQNIAAVNAVTTLPVLRPLCGMDKLEIIDDAQRIGTFEISIQPDQDCCQLFLPPDPVLFATTTECEAAEAKLDVEALLKDALERSERKSFRWPEPARVALTP